MNQAIYRRSEIEKGKTMKEQGKNAIKEKEVETGGSTLGNKSVTVVYRSML